MKRLISFAVALLLCVTLFAVTASAATASASLTGPGTVRAGDTITLTLNLSGSGLYGASGTLSYNTSQLTLTGTTQKIGNGWKVDFNGNTFLAYDDNLAKPINSNTALLAVTFKVNSSLTVGTNISVSYTGVTASDGNADANVGTVTYSKTIAAPLSTNNALASLTVDNATISPAFSADVTNYTASVPFEVNKLNVSATAADSKAKVSVNSPDLTPNGTTSVTVTVTAENGSAKTYTISVARAQDPNYVPSNDNNLAEIMIDGFLLSPVFSADNTEYVVWLPYETEIITVSGTPADSKASVEVVGGDNLVAGQDNAVKVICTAENGETKEYTVIAKRAAAHGGSTEETPDDSTPPVTQPNDDPTTDTQPDTNECNAGGLAWWWLIIVGFLALALGFACGFFGKDFFKKK